MISFIVGFAAGAILATVSTLLATQHRTTLWVRGRRWTDDERLIDRLIRKTRGY